MECSSTYEHIQYEKERTELVDEADVGLLQLFIIGTCGMIGTDDVLACFVAGNVFTIEYVSESFDSFHEKRAMMVG